MKEQDRFCSIIFDEMNLDIFLYDVIKDLQGKRAEQRKTYTDIHNIL